MKFYGNKLTLKLLKYGLLAPKNTYIFKGPKGLGKFIVAKRFAKSLLCFSPNEKNCNCISCKKYASGNHPDLIVVSPEGNSIKKEQVLELKRETSTNSLLSSRKIFLIDDANTMTSSAQNALLKTIEESFDFNIFIFISHGNLLSTVESRGEIYCFEPLSNSQVKHFLEDYTLDTFQKELVLTASQGSIGIAINLMQHETFKGFSSKIEQLYKLNTLSPLEMLKLFNLLKEKDKESFYEIYNEFIYEFLYILKTFYMDIIKASMKDVRHISFKSHTAEYNDIKDDYSIRSLNQLIALVDTAISKYTSNKFTQNEFFDLIRGLSVI